MAIQNFLSGKANSVDSKYCSVEKNQEVIYARRTHCSHISHSSGQKFSTKVLWIRVYMLVYEVFLFFIVPSNVTHILCFVSLFLGKHTHAFSIQRTDLVLIFIYIIFIWIAIVSCRPCSILQKSERNRFVFKTMFLYQTLVVKTIHTDRCHFCQCEKYVSASCCYKYYTFV